MCEIGKCRNIVVARTCASELSSLPKCFQAKGWHSSKSTNQSPLPSVCTGPASIPSLEASENRAQSARQNLRHHVCAWQTQNLPHQNEKIKKRKSNVSRSRLYPVFNHVCICSRHGCVFFFFVRFASTASEKEPCSPSWPTW